MSLIATIPFKRSGVLGPRLLHPDSATMPAAAASRNGSSVTAIRAIPRSTRSTGSSKSRSPRRGTTCSGSWRTCRSIARVSAVGPGSRSKPTCIAAPASNSSSTDYTAACRALRAVRCHASTLPSGPLRGQYHRLNLQATTPMVGCGATNERLAAPDKEKPPAVACRGFSECFKSFGIRSCAERERSGTRCSGP